MKNTGSGNLHFTISSWETMAAAKQFAHSGFHQQAINAQGQLASEVRIYSFEGQQMPSWNEAMDLVQQKGRLFHS